MAYLRFDNFGPDLLAPCNLSIDRGETVTLSGPSGTGKTLFLRALADLDDHKGQAWLEDRRCTDYPPTDWRRTVCYLPAESFWWGELVEEHFPDGKVNHISELGLSAEIPKWTVSRLSSGERQRLAIARLLSVEPSVLLLDEPTANLDPTNTRLVEDVIHTYQSGTDALVIWTSHDQAQRDRLGERHWVIQNGGIVDTP